MQVEHAFGVDGAWEDRGILTLEKKGATYSGKIPALAWPQGLLKGDFYRVRVASNGTGSAAVTSAVKTCALQAAKYSHTLAFHIDDKNFIHSIEILPAVGAGFSGCNAVAAAAKEPKELTSRVSVVPVEDAFSIPLFVQGKGAPYAGQQEVSAADVERAADSLHLDPEAKARLAAQAAQQAPPKEEAGPTGLFGLVTKYWYIVLPLVIFSLFNGGGGGQGDGAGAQGGGGGGGGGGGARGSR